MRGRFADQGGLFSYISPEIRVLVRDVLSEMNPQLGEALRERRTSLDPSGAVAERIAAAGVLRHSVGTPVDGTTGLQSFVPLVRGAFAGRPGLGPDQLHQESGPAAEWRDFCKVHDQASEPSAGQATVVRRAFFGGRNADRSLGFTEELSSQGRQRRR